MILTRKLSYRTEGRFYALNITDDVRAVIADAAVQEGSVLVYYQHTTGAILVVEHEVGILADLEDVLEAILPVSGEYHHHRRGFDQNGAAHVRTALLNPSVTLPLSGGELLIGQYQEVLMLDMDPQGSLRLVIVQVMGE